MASAVVAALSCSLRVLQALALYVVRVKFGLECIGVCNMRVEHKRVDLSHAKSQSVAP